MASTSIFEKLKEVFRHSIVYGITSSLQSLLGFILLPLLTSYYETEVFGVYSLLLLMSAVANSLFYFGASSALSRFYYDEDTKKFRQKIVSASLLVALFGALLLISISLLFGNDLSEYFFDSRTYSGAILLTMAGTAAGFLVNLMTLILRFNQKSVIFMVCTISGVLLNFLITYFLLTRFNLGLEAPLYGLLVSNGLIFIVLFIFHLDFIVFTIQKSHLRLIISFGVQSSIISFLFYVMDWVDRLIIKDLLNLSQVGIYSLGYRLGSAIQILFIIPFSLVWSPVRMRYWKDNNAGVFMSRVTSYYTLVGLYVVLVALLFGEELITLFFKNEEYYGALSLFPIIMFSLLIYGYQNILDFGIFIERKLHVYILVYLFGIAFNVMLNYTLIPLYGYMAAALSTLLTYCFTIMVIYKSSNRYFKINIELPRVVLPSCLIVSVYFLISFTRFFAEAAILKKAVLLIMVFLITYKYWLNQTERDWISLQLIKFKMKR